MVVSQKLYTADDLWRLSLSADYSEKRLELSEGELIEMSPAGGLHGGIAGLLLIKVGNHVVDNDLGFVTAAETGFVLFKNPSGKDTVRAPDVAFVRKERLPDGLPDEYVPLAPDLAVEVVSTHDQADDIQKKLTDYLKFGVRLIWFFYPKSKTVNVHTPRGTQILSIDDTLDGGDVFPGFTLPIREIFKD